MNREIVYFGGLQKHHLNMDFAWLKFCERCELVSINLFHVPQLGGLVNVNKNLTLEYLLMYSRVIEYCLPVKPGQCRPVSASLVSPDQFLRVTL